MIVEVANSISDRFKFWDFITWLVLLVGSNKVQASIQPRGNDFTPQSSPELTQFCYHRLLHSIAGLGLSIGRLCMCVCVYAVPPVWLTSLAVAVWQIDRHLLLVKAFRSLGLLAHFLHWSHMRWQSEKEKGERECEKDDTTVTVLTFSQSWIVCVYSNFANF